MLFATHDDDDNADVGELMELTGTVVKVDGCLIVESDPSLGGARFLPVFWRHSTKPAQLEEGAPVRFGGRPQRELSSVFTVPDACPTNLQYWRVIEIGS
jgi:hypothetical protein